ncbi:hypothetical protein [Synechococcus sp. LTW-G]
MARRFGVSTPAGLGILCSTHATSQLHSRLKAPLARQEVLLNYLGNVKKQFIYIKKRLPSGWCRFTWIN